MLSYNHISLILKRVPVQSHASCKCLACRFRNQNAAPPDRRNLPAPLQITVDAGRSLSRAVYETYCQCLLIAAAKRKTGGRFCSPPAPVRLRRTSSDTKRFTRTVREADSSIGWREDEQAAVSRIDRAVPPKGNKTGIQPVQKNSQRQSHRSCKPDFIIVRRCPDPILRSGLQSPLVP